MIGPRLLEGYGLLVAHRLRSNDCDKRLLAARVKRLRSSAAAGETALPACDVLVVA